MVLSYLRIAWIALMSASHAWWDHEQALGLLFLHSEFFNVPALRFKILLPQLLSLLRPVSLLLRFLLRLLLLLRFLFLELR